MKYKIYIERYAQKALAKIPSKDQEKIIGAIKKLSENPRPNNSKKLSGRAGSRLRVGDYRIIYEIADNKLLILVVEIGHRKEVYRKKR